MADTSYLDWPFFEERHRALAADLADFARDAFADLEAAGEPDDESALDAHCRTILARLARAGLLRHCVPAAHGGASERLDVRSLCLLREGLARAHALADFVFAMQGLGSGAITLFGDDRQKARWLPGVARGERIAAFALSEENAGSDVAAMTTRARRDGDEYVIDGEKLWISNGGLADFYVLFARTDPQASGAKGVSAFVVAADSPGLEIAERIPVIAPHPLARLRLSGVRVPVACRLGEEGQGFRIALATLDVFRATVGAAALGMARRAFDEALARVRSREMFGATMAELPLVQAMLADMALMIDRSALLVYRAAWTRDAGAERVTREAAMAKLEATESAQAVIDRAVQIFGGLGVRRGSVVERLYREVRALRIYEGASEVQRLVIARTLLRGS